MNQTKISPHNIYLLEVELAAKISIVNVIIPIRDEQLLEIIPGRGRLREQMIVNGEMARADDSMEEGSEDRPQ